MLPHRVGQKYNPIGIDFMQRKPVRAVIFLFASHVSTAYFPK